MKKLLLGAILLFSTLSFSQSEEVTINTNSMTGGGVSMDIDYEIKITDKLLTLKMTDEKQIKKIQKYSNIDLHQPQTLLDLEAQGIKFVSKMNDVYKYQSNNIRITIVDGQYVKSLQVEMIDDFTKEITKLIYIKI